MTPWEPDRIVAECDKGQRTQEGLRISEGKETDQRKEGNVCPVWFLLVQKASLLKSRGLSSSSEFDNNIKCYRNGSFSPSSYFQIP